MPLPRLWTIWHEQLPYYWPDAMPEFSLTTLRQPIDQMVRNAVRLMVDAIDKAPSAKEKVALVPTLIKRGSTMTRN
ncbi:MAG: substrate-binding domain-containing protein [Geminicoccaceae bacterium]